MKQFDWVNYGCANKEKENKLKAPLHIIKKYSLPKTLRKRKIDGNYFYVYMRVIRKFIENIYASCVLVILMGVL